MLGSTLQVSAGVFGPVLDMRVGAISLQFLLDPDALGDLAVALWECSPTGTEKYKLSLTQIEKETPRDSQSKRESKNPKGSEQAPQAEKADITEASKEGGGPKPTSYTRI